MAFYITENGPPDPEVVADWVRRRGARAWISNRSKRLTEAEVRQLARRLPERTVEEIVYRTPGDQAIVEMPKEMRGELKAAFEHFQDKPERLSRIAEGEQGWVFNLLNIGWWERRSSVEKAGIVLVPIAAGLAVTKALEWW